MSSSRPGGNISDRPEVTNISGHGIWLLTREGEFFLAFEHFPWFREKPVAQIFNVVEPAPGHYWWPELDIDLAREAIEHPERFPLVAGQ